MKQIQIKVQVPKCCIIFKPVATIVFFALVAVIASKSHNYLLHKILSDFSITGVEN